MLRFIVIALGALTLGFSACDTDSGRCTSDYDCADQLVCEVATGKCATYGCQNCTEEQVCEDNRCVTP